MNLTKLYMISEDEKVSDLFLELVLSKTDSWLLRIYHRLERRGIPPSVLGSIIENPHVI